MSKNIKKKFGDKIYVEWIDTYTNDDWESVEKALNVSDAPYCYTNAFFLGQNKDFLMVMHTKGKTIKNDVMGRITIPKVCIRKIK